MFKDNEPFSSLTHFIGLLLAIAALPILIVFAVKQSTPWHVVTYSIYSASMILLYLASAVYHLFSKTHKIKKYLRLIDHAMIYILIAGTNTPICLVALKGGWGWSMFGVIWGLAILGVIIKFWQIKIPGWLSALLYILMGWIIIIAAPPLIKVLSPMGLWWLIAGGVFYTVGVIFFGLGKIVPTRSKFGMHEIFHIFVLAGSFSHFWLMFKYLIKI